MCPGTNRFHEWAPKSSSTMMVKPLGTLIYSLSPCLAVLAPWPSLGWGLRRRPLLTAPPLITFQGSFKPQSCGNWDQSPCLLSWEKVPQERRLSLWLLLLLLLLLPPCTQVHAAVLPGNKGSSFPFVSKVTRCSLFQDQRCQRTQKGHLPHQDGTQVLFALKFTDWW